MHFLYLDNPEYNQNPSNSELLDSILQDITLPNNVGSVRSAGIFSDKISLLRNGIPLSPLKIPTVEIIRLDDYIGFVKSSK